jgi:hypothetical protein
MAKPGERVSQRERGQRKGEKETGAGWGRAAPEFRNGTITQFGVDLSFGVLLAYEDHRES